VPYTDVPAAAAAAACAHRFLAEVAVVQIAAYTHHYLMEVPAVQVAAYNFHYLVEVLVVQVSHHLREEEGHNHYSTMEVHPVEGCLMPYLQKEVPGVDHTLPVVLEGQVPYS